MINIDKLDELPFREAVNTRFRSDSQNSLRKRYRTERISNKEWKIVSDAFKHNVGKSIDHAYSNFCYRSTGYRKYYLWRMFEVSSYGAEYKVVDGLIVYDDDYSWKKYKKGPVKSEYRNPKLVQARVENKQQEKRNLRLRKLSQKNRQFNLIHFSDKYKKQIQSLTKLYRKGNIDSLFGYKAAIVEFSDGINKTVLLLDYYPDLNLRYNIRESIKLLKLLE